MKIKPGTLLVWTGKENPHYSKYAIIVNETTTYYISFNGRCYFNHEEDSVWEEFLETEFGVQTLFQTEFGTKWKIVDEGS